MEKVCEHCGAKVVEYKHGLSKGLIRVLWKIIRVNNGSLDEFEFRDVKLTYSEGSNFQKLRYWGLIEKVGSWDGKGGIWRLTEKGINFAKGDVSLQKFVRTYRGEVVSYSGCDVTVEEITNGWKYRPDYAIEAIPHREEV